MYKLKWTWGFDLGMHTQYRRHCTGNVIVHSPCVLYDKMSGSSMHGRSVDDIA